MKKAIIYARQSSGSESHSESIDMQIKNALSLARKMGLEVIDICHDYNISGKTYPAGFEAVAENDKAFLNWYSFQSGYKKYRDGMGKLFQNLKIADYIIVDEITRLYRPLSNSFLESLVNQKLIENRVQILQVKGGIVDLSLFDQHLITMLKNQINDEQIAKQRQKSIEVMAKMRDDGYLPTGPKAWGLDYNKKNKKISMSPAKAQVVRDIYESIENGMAYYEIIRQINQKYHDFFKSCFWSRNFYNIARNPIYCGWQYNSKGELIKNKQWNGVVSFEYFEKIQKILHSRRLNENGNKSYRVAGVQKHFLPLSGYVYCGNCGSRLLAGISRERIYYYCRSGNFRKDKSCQQSRIFESINHRFICGLKEGVFCFFEYFLKYEIQRLQRNKQKNAEQTDSENFMRQLSEEQTLLTRAFINNALKLSEYNIRIKNLMEKMRLVKERCSYEKNTFNDDHFEYIKQLYFKYKRKKIENEEYVFLLKNTLKKIVVYQDKVVFETFFGSFERRRKILKRQKGIAKR